MGKTKNNPRLNQILLVLIKKIACKTKKELAHKQEAGRPRARNQQSEAFVLAL